MLARDHALSGALVFTGVAPVLHVSGPALLAGAVFTAGAATVPDIDEHGSTISRTLGFFTETVSTIQAQSIICSVWAGLLCTCGSARTRAAGPRG